MEKYKRICSICGREMEYSSRSSYALAEKNKAVCRKCATRATAKRKCDLSALLNETPEAYYWIGFLLADGSFIDGRIKFHLKLDDSEQVKRFGEFIKWTGKYNDRGELGIGISAKHTDIVNQIISKFDIKPNKTYNPPSTIMNHDKGLLIFLMAGFIDGDGNINKQSGGRSDCFIRIKLHSSWKHILEEFCELIDYDKSHVKINSSGYSELIISDSSVILDLKKRVTGEEIPLLERKWSKIDETFISRNIKAKETRDKVLKMLSEGRRNCDISKELLISPSLVTKISKEHERKY